MRYYLLVTVAGDPLTAKAAMRFDQDRLITQRWTGVGWEDQPSMIEYLVGDARNEAVEVTREDVEDFLGASPGL